MTDAATAQQPHRRLNPLTGEWVLISPHRTLRPWQGRMEQTSAPAALTYDPGCYLCPGNTRSCGLVNPPYASTFVFDNDFPALLPSGERTVPPYRTPCGRPVHQATRSVRWHSATNSPRDERA
ncbi:MAG: galactose-1-phosphate uridylyltransferase [Acidobacteria bacterium]|nr:galactose-1-phosphate uridylyltransferase [Acidobacteriota bacterium]